MGSDPVIPTSPPRTALVTGAASGIGLACARELARRGHRLVLVDRNGAALAAVADGLRVVGAVCLAVTADVTNPADATSMVDSALNHYGSADILIHSAGIGAERPFLDTSPEEWRRILEVNLTGTFLCAQAAARAMAARGWGRIVLLASTAGMRGGVGRAAYGASKGGVIALTRVMAVELAEHGISVNALAPGAIETELVARMHSAETRRIYRAAIPMDRYGTPEEVAHAAAFLTGEEAGYITGEVLTVDGGFVAAGLMARRGG